MPVSAQDTQGQYIPPPPPRPLPAPTTSASGTQAPAPLPPKSISQTEATQGPPPQFKVNGEPRALATGYYGALLVGANFAHDDDLSSVGGVVSASDSASAQPFASIKFGYTWAFNQPPAEQFSDVAQSPGLFFSGGLEIEGMYVRSRLGINTDTPMAGSNLTFNTGAIMINAFLKAQSGKFRFYAGPGFGPAFVGYSDFQGSGGSTDVNLAYQFSAGIDYFITPEWSIFTEYKWFVLDDLKLYGGANKLDFGNYQQHLIGLGVRRSF
ncbi:MAG: outer membrane beta-barrel protein [Verrucomicrobiales bacterium]|jgi:opacity protein-like surface antigen|nr:outer membrane beta-barrel protein [Verrucomicrobiales bacterium]